LKKAKERLDESERRYANLAQEQLIFLIKTKLKNVLKEQEKINALTEKLGAKVDMGQRLLRSDRRSILEAAATQEALAEKVHKEMEKKIQSEAFVFTWVIRSMVEDMRSVAGLLRESPPDVGSYTRGIQREIVVRIKELLKAFKLELKRRQGQPKPKKGGGGGRPRLVPALAELQMLKFMESELRARTRALSARITSGTELKPVERKMIDRLTHEQGDIAGVLKKFIEAYTRELQEAASEQRTRTPEE